MYARYLDAMAAVLSLGPPSLFVTMTANPKWPEVQSSLAYGQKAEDRPDVITRVFHAKVLELVKDLEHQFGQTECIVRVIEFQMRGLPHAHIVVIMKAAYRPRTGAQIDSLATAELPPMPPDDDDSDAANVQRRLRALVLEHMVHNDCTGAQGRRCPCYDDVNKRCRGRFPYEYVETTSIGDGKSKPTLRRRRGECWTANLPSGRCVTNQWVVPYNPALLLKYNCHINVEVVTAEYAIKYLFKYVHLHALCHTVCTLFT